MRGFGYTFLFILFSLVGAAQPAQYYFKHLSVEDGLTNNQITAFLKDSKGFLWVGTNSGLNRFDGYKVRTFFHDSRDSTSLPHNNVIGLFETPEGQIAVTTPLGLCLFNPLSERFERNFSDFSSRYNIPASSLNTIIRDDKGQFWFVLRNSLLVFDPSTKTSQQVVHTATDSLTILQDSIAAFIPGAKGHHWLMHSNGIVEKISETSAGIKVSYRNYSLYKKNKGQRYSYTLTPDRDGDLWITVLNDNQGVYLISEAKGNLEQFSTSSSPIRLNTNIAGSVVEDNNGKIWIGTDHGGINIIDKNQRTVEYVWTREGDSKSLPENSIKTIYRDYEGIIWVGTFKRGVGFYHENIFRFALYNRSALEAGSLPFADVNRFVEDENGNLWIGTNGGGLIHFDRASGKYKQYKHDPRDPNSLSADVIVSLWFDSQKRLWVGTYYGGLNMFDGKRFVRYQYGSDENTLPGRSVWELFEDSNKNFWVGTLEGGLAILDREIGKFKRFKVGGANAVQSTYIAALTEDNTGNIWIGTSQGIDVYSSKDGTFTHYSANSGREGSLSSNNIMDIHQDAAGRVWIATSEGLDVFLAESKTFQTFTRNDGLPHTTILTIEEDSNGDLWLGTPNGLSLVRVDRKKDRLTIRCRTFRESDGLQGLQFNENASLRTRSGELVFGGPSGFNIFKASSPEASASRRSVVFTDFQLAQRSIGIGERLGNDVILPESIGALKEIELASDRNTFSIEVSALEFLHPEQIVYQYRMTGLNDEWIALDPNTRKVTFTSLNPGEYIFEVRAGDPERNLFGDPSSLEIVIPPPFWKSKTAFVLYVVFIAAILYLARQMIQQREHLKYAIERERQEAIRLHELDMMKIKFFTNVSHEFRTPITLILTPLEKLIKSASEPGLRDQYQMIHRNARRLLSLVNQLLDFRKLEVQEIRFTPSEGDIIAFIRDVVSSFSDLSEKKIISLQFKTTIETLDTVFDQDKLEKILFNLLSNAFKFTLEKGSVEVRLSSATEGQNSFLRIEVEDTGIGISSEKIGKIFDRFFQTELPPSIINQGTGIGLSITKEFVRVHGGTIDVSSEPGSGTVFTVLIPVREIASAPLETVQVQETMTPAITEHEVADAGEKAEAKDDSNKKKTLLLVEDNDDFRFYLKDNLKMHYSIVEAGNGLDGWKAVLHEHPDLIVSDVMMPAMNGMELCKKVKGDERVSHIPVILLTARTSEEQKLEGFETGADDYITKPFNFELLESRIRNLITLREKSQKVLRKTLDVKASELNITPLDTKLIEKAIKCVEANISSPEFSVEDLGRELGISRAYLYKKLVALTGKSPLEFIRSIRLQHAAQLLEKSQLTVSEVAYQVGFNNPKYFARYFKEEYNILPSAYAAAKKAEGLRS